MALQITETRRMFSVFGELNSANVNILNRHMQLFIDPTKPVTLNLERLKGIDAIAAIKLQKMYQAAMQNNCVLAIIGLTNGNIVPTLKQTNTSYIFSDDRI